MASFVVMMMTVAMWLLPAAGDVTDGLEMDYILNTTLTYDAVTEVPRNSSVKKLIFYKVSRLLVYILVVVDPTRDGSIGKYSSK